jgi:S-adenosylmethionine hydrolase
VLSLVYEKEERVTVRRITAEHYYLQPVSQTFHGRDIFAAVAGWLSKGIDLEKFGDVVEEYVRFSMPRPKVLNTTTMKGVILKVDKFGNLITNIRPQDAPQLFATPAPPFKIVLGKAEIAKVKQAYAEGSAGEVFAIPGSMGFLEVSANRGNAAQIVQANKGSEVHVVFEEAQFEPPPPPA